MVKRNAMAFVLANIEIILSAVGLLIVLVPALVDPKQENFWEVMAITAILVGFIHGFIFLAGSQKAAYSTSTAPQ